ncbi:hypothetical protein [Streptomyces sp. LNU-CPARS28]|uniref:hypothetical protein n=1 Tax=Streptomyces sp. LNU-CPARS28 TaxID=3137371 RepID=UPI0031376286
MTASMFGVAAHFAEAVQESAALERAGAVADRGVRRHLGAEAGVRHPGPVAVLDEQPADAGEQVSSCVEVVGVRLPVVRLAHRAEPHDHRARRCRTEGAPRHDHRRPLPLRELAERMCCEPFNSTFVADRVEEQGSRGWSRAARAPATVPSRRAPLPQQERGTLQDLLQRAVDR